MKGLGQEIGKILEGKIKIKIDTQVLRAIGSKGW